MKRTRKHSSREIITIGWREWIALPELGVSRIKAKVDTGARTSVLHVHHVEELGREDSGTQLRIHIHPHQKSTEEDIVTEVLAHDHRKITSSAGHAQHRYVITTPAQIGSRILQIEISLTNRDAMGFRMLLGRSALRKGFLINPRKSFLLKGQEMEN